MLVRTGLSKLTLGVLATAAMSAAAAGQCRYELTVIEHYCQPDDTSPTVPTAINDNGDICGFVTICTVGDKFPFVWTEAGGLQLLLGPPGTKSGTAYGIHNDGRIVGEINIPGPSAARAFVYDAGQWTMLDPVFPDGPAQSSARAIDDDGTIVGRRGIAEDSHSPWNAFIWHECDGFTDLGVMNGPRSEAAAISNGRVVGSTGASAAGDNAFIHDSGQTTVLDPIPGGSRSSAKAVNASGAVCGGGRLPVDGEPPTCCSRAFVWSSGVYEVLEPIAAHERSWANAISEEGVVLGQSWTGGTNGLATMWIDGRGIDINKLIIGASEVRLFEAVAVNSSGQIAAAASGPMGILAVRLDPISPSPADLDGDCDTDHGDMMKLFDDWGRTESIADLNADGTVDALDFLFLLAHWG